MIPGVRRETAAPYPPGDPPKPYGGCEAALSAAGMPAAGRPVLRGCARGGGRDPAPPQGHGCPLGRSGRRRCWRRVHVLTARCGRPGTPPGFWPEAPWAAGTCRSGAASRARPGGAEDAPGPGRPGRADAAREGPRGFPAPAAGASAQASWLCLGRPLRVGRGLEGLGLSGRPGAGLAVGSGLPESCCSVTISSREQEEQGQCPLPRRAPGAVGVQS